MITERDSKLLEDFGITINKFYRMISVVRIESELSYSMLLSENISNHGYSSLNRLTEEYEEIIKKVKKRECILDYFYYLIDENKCEIDGKNNRYHFSFKYDLDNLIYVLSEIKNKSKQHNLEIVICEVNIDMNCEDGKMTISTNIDKK